MVDHRIGGRHIHSAMITIMLVVIMLLLLIIISDDPDISAKITAIENRIAADRKKSVI
jgi:hypothetical protein